MQGRILQWATCQKRCDNWGHQTKDCHSLPSGPKGEANHHGIKCYNCELLGHIAAKYRKPTCQGRETGVAQVAMECIELG